MANNSNDDITEFGFDDSDHIKTNSIDKFSQSKAGEKARICIVSFNRFHDVVLRSKTREKGAPLTDEEKAGILQKVEIKLAEKLNKSVSDLTDADRLDIRSPKFWNSYTHFDEKEEKGGNGLGTFRCVSKWNGNQCTHPEVCCKKFGDPDQKIACVIMKYPVDNKGGVDVSLLKDRKYTEFFLWVQSAKKFKKVESCYAESKSDEKYIIDLKVELDGDPKFQKQLITASSSCVWARDDFDVDTRNWILEQGLRASNYVAGSLGFKIEKEKLVERLERGRSVRQFENSDSGSATPKLNAGYDQLI